MGAYQSLLDLLHYGLEDTRTAATHFDSPSIRHFGSVWRVNLVNPYSSFPAQDILTANAGGNNTSPDTVYTLPVNVEI